MDAVKFARELGRMCESLNGNCKKCKMDEMGSDESCIDWFSEYPEQAVSIVEQWSAEHPAKTCLNDFKEKYPKGIVGYRTWCELYNNGNLFAEICGGAICPNCPGWSEPAEKYL